MIRKSNNPFSLSISRRSALKTLGAGAAASLGCPAIIRSARASEVELRAMLFNVAWGDAMAKRVSDAYYEYTDGRVRLVGDLTPYENLYEKMVLELSAGSDTYDIVSSDVFWIRQLIVNNWVANLDDIRATNLSLPDIQWDNLNSSPFVYSVIDDKHVAVPVSLSTPTFVYRKDLFEAAGITEVPRDWNAFTEACKKLHTEDRAALIMLLGGQDACVTEWVVRLSSMNEVPWGSDNVLGDGGKPIFNTDRRGARAIETMKDVLPYTPRGVMNLDYPDAVTLMAGDKAAMLITWNEAVPGIEDSALKGKFGYTTYPVSSVPNHVVGGFHILANNASSNKEEVYKFFAWMSEGRAYEMMRENGEAALVLKSDLANPNIAKEIPMTALWNDFNALNFNAMALTPYSVTNADQVQRILFEEVVNGVSGDKDPDSAMADAEERILESYEG